MRTPPCRRNTGSADWAPAFLAHLRGSANVRASCRAAGVSAAAAYARRATDLDLAAAWADALAEGVEDLEAIAFARARAGSTRLLVFLLTALRPEVYRPGRPGADGGEAPPIIAEILDAPAPLSG